MTHRIDDLGLSEVIGFILLLALIMTALSLWMVYMVPAQGREQEISHMDEVQDQMIGFKLALDPMWMTNYNKVPPLSPPTGSTKITLGSLGKSSQAGGLNIPLIQPIGSSASIAINNTGDTITITTSDPLKNVSVPLSKLSYQSHDNYWIQQEYYYQMGGVFLSQDEGVTCRVSPFISIYNINNTMAKVVVVPVGINGGGIIAGEGNVLANSRLNKSGSNSISGKYDWVKISIDVDCHAAKMWENLLKSIAARENIPTGWYTISNVSTCSNLPTERRVVFMNIVGPPTFNDVQLNVTDSMFDVTLNNIARLGPS